MADAIQTILENSSNYEDNPKDTLQRIDHNFLFQHATRFEIPTKQYTDPRETIKIEYRGKHGEPDADVWAILDQHGNCYNKTEKDWEIEPLPSNRTDDFLENCRFTLKEALAIVRKLR